MSAPTTTPAPEQESAGEPPPRRSAGRGPAEALKTGARRLVAGARGLASSGTARAPWLLGIVAALWAAGIGLVIAIVPLILVWMATPQSGLTWLESLRVAGLLWVVAHGAPITIAITTYSLVPWGLAVVLLLLLGYAGGWAARRANVATVRSLVVLVATGAVAYAVIVGVVASTSARPTSMVATLPAVAYAFVLAALALGWGAVRHAEVDVVAMAPAWVRIPVRAGFVGALTILGLGALAAAVALIVHVDDAVTMAQSLHAGLWGGLALLALGLAYVPVMVVWAGSYVLGAGVVIGPGVAVSPFVLVTAPTQLPPFPMLAAVPQSAGPMSFALPLTGILAGVLAGILISRRSRLEPRLVRLAMAVGAAAVSGLVMALLAYLASGSLGDVRLASVGPPALTVGILAFVLVTLGAVPSAVIGAPPAKPQLAVATVVDTTPATNHDVGHDTNDTNDDMNDDTNAPDQQPVHGEAPE